MAIKTKKRQKQLERKKAKRKAKRYAVSRRNSLSLAARMELAASAPVLHCSVTDSLWDDGIGNLLFSRQLPDARVAVACFLVDAYCLGVKDALAVILPRPEYRERFERLVDGPDVVELTPPFARSVVEGAVEFARRLGFRPHPDYRKASPIFGDVDPNECSEEFEFGRNGRPCFIPGPNDDPRKCKRIRQTLESTCGVGGFDFSFALDANDIVELAEYDYDE